MNTKTNHSIVSPSEWLAARKELLAEEKRLTRQMDAVRRRGIITACCGFYCKVDSEASPCKSCI